MPLVPWIEIARCHHDKVIETGVKLGKKLNSTNDTVTWEFLNFENIGELYNLDPLWQVACIWGPGENDAPSS
jgi:hypothetical protein